MAIFLIEDRSMKVAHGYTNGSCLTRPKTTYTLTLSETNHLPLIDSGAFKSERVFQNPFSLFVSGQPNVFNLDSYHINIAHLGFLDPKIYRYLPLHLPVQGLTLQASFLVGGFNPSEKYTRQTGSSPKVGVKINIIWNHHLVVFSTPHVIIHLETPKPFQIHSGKLTWNLKITQLKRKII